MKLLLILLSLLAASCGWAQNKKTILAVFAHPDDETVIGEVLVKYAKLGHKMLVMIATDGKDGTRVTKIPAGDSLGKLRKQETICACRKMGIETPIFLSIDRLDTKNGVGNYFNNHKKLRTALRQHIESINPDLIITFGPDGDTHHSEHIVIGGAVTEVLLEQGWVDRYPLYYVAWTKADALNDLGIVNTKYLNLRVDYSDADERQALEAFTCYATQFTPEEIKKDYDLKIRDTVQAIYFRTLSVKRGLVKEFFTGGYEPGPDKTESELLNRTKMELIKKEVLLAGREYNELMKRLKSGRPYEELVKNGYLAALNQMLADEYSYTARDGAISNKKEDMESYKTNKNILSSANLSGQEVRVLAQNIAVETGTIHYVGRNFGKPFDLRKRYTTTWIRREGRWQIVADHTSKIGP
jgi:LmbE family N-acetylglucosaminyl deacetylase